MNVYVYVYLCVLVFVSSCALMCECVLWCFLSVLNM